LAGGQNPAAQLVLHHAVSVASPEMLVHVEAFAASGEGSSVVGRLASGAANEAAAPNKQSIGHAWLHTRPSAALLGFASAGRESQRSQDDVIYRHQQQKKKLLLLLLQLARHS
jgi:hypothetical protein